MEKNGPIRPKYYSELLNREGAVESKNVKNTKQP